MPYISKDKRYFLDRHICHSISAGDLNYQFTMLAKDYLKNNGKTYRTMNDVIGAFECAKLEFYRRAVVPYEREKIKENGDLG